MSAYSWGNTHEVSVKIAPLFRVNFRIINTHFSVWVSIIYSGDRRLSFPTALGAAWSAAFEVIASMMLGNLNANARAEMSCEDLKQTVNHRFLSRKRNVANDSRRFFFYKIIAGIKLFRLSFFWLKSRVFLAVVFDEQNLWIVTVLSPVSAGFKDFSSSIAIAPPQFEQNSLVYIVRASFEAVSKIFINQISQEKNYFYKLRRKKSAG